MSLRDATAAETPDTEGVADAEQQIRLPSLENARLEQAAVRLRELAARAEAERAAAAALSIEKGVAAALRASPRTPELDRLCAAREVSATDTGTTAQKLRQVNASLRAVRDSLVANPLWISATLQEAAPASAAGTHLRQTLQGMEPELKAARDEVARCAGKVLDAEEALRAWESRPALVRAAQEWLLQTGQQARDELAAARAEVSAAQVALDEKHARGEAEAAEAKAAEERTERERRDRAFFHREVLEIPLREALLERAMLADALLGRDVQPLREAPPDERLKILGVHGEPGFTVAVLESPTTSYVADWSSLDDGDKATFSQAIAGDVLCYEQRDDGSRALKCVELAHLTPEHQVLEGVVGATHHRNSAVLEFQLIDAAGTARWVKPSRGDDLARELQGDVETALTAGNHVRIQNREVHVLGRARSQGLER